MIRLATFSLALAVAALACGDGAQPGQSTGGPPPKEPLADQTAPPSINGIVVDGDTIWVASISGDVVLQIDRESGAILERVGTNGGGPDDVAVGPDGAVYYTGFASGDVGRIDDGVATVVANVGLGANPLEFSPDGTLYVGRAILADALYEVPLDGSSPRLIASDLGNMNAFAITENGVILGPAADADGGIVLAIDPTNGSIETVARGLPPVFASALDPDGKYFVLANGSGEVIAVDPETGDFSVVRTVANPPFDNLAFAQDGRLYLSSFTTAHITVVETDGSARVIRVGD